MFYDFEITIPAGTTQASPKEVELKLTHGVIHTVRIDFPPGPRGEVYLAIFQGSVQRYPYNRGGSFRADNTYVNFDDFLELNSEPYTLLARGWSPGAIYDHTLHIEIGLIESKIALASLKLATGIEKFLKLVGIGA
jgi:hypothetical protein